jgi:phage shock protein PspC (stress-responsive transcriptional regulator)
MTLSEELEQLADLHGRGLLSDVEFAHAKARLLEGAGAPGAVPPALAAVNALRRHRDGRWIAGVCSGLASATGAEVWVWRLVFALLATCGGVGVLFYLLMWIFVPVETVLREPVHA